MPDGVSVEFSELNALTASFVEAADVAPENVAKAVTVTSIKTKKDWQEPMKGSRTLGALPYAITFDVEGKSSATESSITSEIGFDKSRTQGPLGNISEYGSPTIAPRGFGLAALEKNLPDFEKGLSIALEQGEKKAGL